MSKIDYNNANNMIFIILERQDFFMFMDLLFFEFI